MESRDETYTKEEAKQRCEELQRAVKHLGDAVANLSPDNQRLLGGVLIHLRFELKSMNQLIDMVLDPAYAR